MKTIGNLIWLIFGGLENCIAWFLLGVLWCITIIGIPFGKQCFKLAGIYAWPFGTKVKTRFSAHPLANIIWIIFGGLELALLNLLVGVIFCITIIGIPFGKQYFKLMKLSLTPFGAIVE